MLRNLCAEMARHNVTIRDIRRSIGKTERTAREKVNGKTDFTFPEAVRVRDDYFPGMTLEYLFARDANEGAAT